MFKFIKRLFCKHNFVPWKGTYQTPFLRGRKCTKCGYWEYDKEE